jgi:hypothetical protein
MYDRFSQSIELVGCAFAMRIARGALEMLILNGEAIAKGTRRSKILTVTLIHVFQDIPCNRRRKCWSCAVFAHALPYGMIIAGWTDALAVNECSVSSMSLTCT